MLNLQLKHFISKINTILSLSLHRWDQRDFRDAGNVDCARKTVFWVSIERPTEHKALVPTSNSMAVSNITQLCIFYTWLIHSIFIIYGVINSFLTMVWGLLISNCNFISLAFFLYCLKDIMLKMHINTRKKCLHKLKAVINRHFIFFLEYITNMRHNQRLFTRVE